jgi:hypothetical protein
MFSTAQQQIIDELVPSYMAQGYKSYIVYTLTNTDGYYSNKPDLCFIFSKTDIVGTSAYEYMAQDSVKILYRTGNYSSGNYADNSDRLSLFNFSGKVSIPVYEHVYTNVSFSSSLVMPDVIVKEVQQNGYQQATFYIIAVFLFVFCFLYTWKIHK